MPMLPLLALDRSTLSGLSPIGWETLYCTVNKLFIDDRIRNVSK